jgi:plasmid maintenance system antidote protein VapI
MLPGMPRESGGRQVERWLFDNRLEQKDLAKMLDVAPSTICRIINGKGRPTVRVALKLEKKTGIPVSVWT